MKITKRKIILLLKIVLFLGLIGIIIVLALNIPKTQTEFYNFADYGETQSDYECYAATEIGDTELFVHGFWREVLERNCCCNQQLTCICDKIDE